MQFAKFLKGKGGKPGNLKKLFLNFRGVAATDVSEDFASFVKATNRS
jgi:hypothetical protein